MAEVIAIFICYKKLLEREEAGQRVIQKNTDAEILNYLLAQHSDYLPWVDEAELSAGMEWERAIYSRLLATDVLLVLVGPGTSASEWVRREIALATALGVSIVPVGSDLSEPEMLAEMKALGIDDLQWTITRNINLNSGAAVLAELSESLRRGYSRTKERQRGILDELWKRRSPPKDKAPDNQNAAEFDIGRGGRRITLHVASGDISKVRDIDVLVNSENDYMQMARFFESHTVSAILRRRGARIRNGRYEDVIQQELDWHLQDRGRPVQAGEVFATSTGGPDSDLARVNRARVILHVAAVQAVEAERKVIPYRQPDQIEYCVRSSLSALAALNEGGGVFSPPGSDQRSEQESRASAGEGTLRSVLFPLFGTGQGGLPAADVLDPMLEGLLAVVSDRDFSQLAETLSDVYISTYMRDDLETITNALRERFP